MDRMIKAFIGGAVVALFLAGASAEAHHSFAMFDRTKINRISGTL
jgi:hypothetical protein